MAERVENRDYFRLPKPFYGIIIAFLMVVFACALYKPESAILDYLGPLGTLARYMHKNHLDLLYLILYVTVVVHAGEAVFAVSYARRQGLSTMATTFWFLQTFMMGFPSLLALLEYKGGRKRS